jgi:antitoxin (DNA-binding transcriptional repressor) of toxin-antitoxin stability system
MKTVEIKDFPALEQAVASGETVELVKDGQPLAHIVPFRRPATPLEASPRGLPEEFFAQPPLDLGTSVLEQLLADRRKNDW